MAEKDGDLEQGNDGVISFKRRFSSKTRVIDGDRELISAHNKRSEMDIISLPKRFTSTASIHLPKKATETNFVMEHLGKEVADEQVAAEQIADLEFHLSEGLSTVEAGRLLREWGRNELSEKTIPKWYIFCSQLWQPMPCMIWIAAIVEAGIENWPDMAILFAILLINASISYYEITKAGDAVAALKASLKPSATVKRDGQWKQIDAGELVPGDLVLLASGSAVPADTRVNHGQIDVDQAALTGESLPVTKYAGESCHMGSNVVKGEVEGTVEFTGSNTFFGKTAALLKDDGEQSNLQKLLIRIMVVLVASSLILCAIVFGYLLGKGQSVKSSLSFTVVLLVASIPIAIEIVCTTTLALGSKQLSAHGAIVTRLAAIEDMAGMTVLCSDKTGTLTLNKMVIQQETPVYQPNETQYSILRYAAMAAKWKEPPRDALDTLVLTSADIPSLTDVTQIDYMPFDPTVKRTEGTLRRENGTVFKVTKGAPHIIVKLTTDKNVIDQVERDMHGFGERGMRSLAVAIAEVVGNQPLNWKVLGLLTFLDPPRPDTKDTIDRARTYGVEVKMITGDHLLIGRETAKVLGLGTDIRGPEGLPLLDPATQTKPKDLSKNFGEYIRSAHGFAQVFPEHKFLIVECLREMGLKVGMTGDGVNDAPALKRADVGVAVDGATDAARAAADIVLTNPGLSTIVEGIVISRCIFVRMKSFITYRIACTMELLVFFFLAVLTLHPSHFQPNPDTTSGFNDITWPQFFHMPVLMLMLITLLNDGTLISIGYDNAVPSQSPEKWNLPALFIVAAGLAIIVLGASLLLLGMALDSWNPSGVFQGLGIGGLTYGQIITMMYLDVSISNFLTLFSARVSGDFFWTSRPSNALLGAACVALSASTAIACSWPQSKPDGIETTGLARHVPKALAVGVWIYCIIWWIVQDCAKVGLAQLMLKYNIMGYADQMKFVEQAKAQAAASKISSTTMVPMHH